MYHPFSRIIFPEDKNLTLEEVKSFLLLKWSDKSHEYFFGRGDIEMNVITANQNSTKTDERNLPNGGNELICDKITQHSNNANNVASLVVI